LLCPVCSKQLELQEHDYYKCPDGHGEWWPFEPDDQDDEPQVKGVVDRHISLAWQGQLRKGKRRGSKRSGRKRRKPHPKRRPWELI
jgi:hypothetical protein